MCPHVKFRSQSTQHKQIVNTALKGNSALQHSWKTNSVSGRKTYAIRKLRVDKSTKGRVKNKHGTMVIKRASCINRHYVTTVSNYHLAKR